MKAPHWYVDRVHDTAVVLCTACGYIWWYAHIDRDPNFDRNIERHATRGHCKCEPWDARTHVGLGEVWTDPQGRKLQVRTVNRVGNGEMTFAEVESS